MNTVAFLQNFKHCLRGVAGYTMAPVATVEFVSDKRVLVGEHRGLDVGLSTPATALQPQQKRDLLATRLSHS